VEIIGLIPARGGSKGIPGKNLQLVGGRPLIEWTCRAAVASTTLSRCVVSTDAPEIAEAARASGVEAPFMRPAELARDETPMIEVVAHALDALDAPDAIVLLQPTSPLRTADHIDAAVRLWEDTQADSVVSVVEVPHAMTPSSLLLVVGGRLEPFAQGAAPTRRQDKERLFARNGPAVLVTRRNVLLGGSLYGEDSRPLEMSAHDSVDVDTPFDLDLADWLLRRGPVE
jgi:CMP-N,N'-diacetyllegionaminic acid synthase